MSVQFVFAFKDILAEVIKDIRNVMLCHSDIPLDIACQILNFLGNNFETEILVDDENKRIDFCIIGNFD